MNTQCLFLLILVATTQETPELKTPKDDSKERKILGSSVVTSVSVILDGTEKHFSDPVGKPVLKPTLGIPVGSPVNLLNPDRYEFYTFNDNGELVKRLMSLEEIQSIIANSEGADAVNFNTQQFYIPEKKVNDVVHNVQNVLREEIEHLKNSTDNPGLFDTPDVSNSWSMILPAIFGNSGEPIKLEKPHISGTPETDLIETTTTFRPPTTTQKIEKLSTWSSASLEPFSKVTTWSSVSKEPAYLETDPQVITVAIITRNGLNDTPTKYTLGQTTQRPSTSYVTAGTSVPDVEVFKNYPTTKATPPVYYNPSSYRPLVKVTSTPQSVQQTLSAGDKITKTPTSPVAQKLSTSQSVVTEIREESKTAPPISLNNYLDSLKNDNAKEDGITYIGSSTRAIPSITRAPSSVKYTTSTPRIPSSTNTIPLTTKLTKLQTLSPITQFVNLFTTTSKATTTTTTPKIETTTKKLPEVTQTLPFTSTLYIYDHKTNTRIPITTKEQLNNFLNTLPAITAAKTPIVTTTQSPSTLNDLPHELDVVPEILDQLLLTSTNIYEINSELAKTGTDIDLATKEMSTIPPKVVVVSTTTTPEPVEEATTNVTILDDVATTTINHNRVVINSIEELLKQAVGDIAVVVNSTEDRVKIEKFFATVTNKKEADTTVADNVQTESATVASTVLANDFLFNEAVESLLSQVVNSASEHFTQSTAVQENTEPILESRHKTTDILSEQDDFRTTDFKQDTTRQFTESTTQTTGDSTTEESSTFATEKSLPNTNAAEILNTEATTYFETDFNDSTNDLKTETKVIRESSTISFNPETVQTVQPTFETTTVKEETTLKEIVQQLASTTTIKVEESTVADQDDKNWSLVSTISPNSKWSTLGLPSTQIRPQMEPPKPVDLISISFGYGLEDSVVNLDPDVQQFIGLCNELAFGFWSSVTKGVSSARSIVVSPFAATSLLAMVFLGARGATSGEMNEILKLDDMVTFNPHMIFKNVTESIEIGKREGVATSVILRELYSDRSKGHLLNFYKERAKQFYDGHVEEVSFRDVGNTIKRRTNMLVKRYTLGKIPEFIKDGPGTVKPPLAGVSVSIFHTDCSAASTEGRDGELYFVVLPSVRQRRLVPVPAAVWRGSGFLAGYEPGLDATAVSLGTQQRIVSVVFVIPGQQGVSAPGDGLARLERQLLSPQSHRGREAWSSLLRCLIPRPGLEVQIPRFSHRSVINSTLALQHMGMKDLFSAEKADLRGLNGVTNDLFLSDILQINHFATCGEDLQASQTHHHEIYPATAKRIHASLRRTSRHFEHRRPHPFTGGPPDLHDLAEDLLAEPRDYQRAFHDPSHDATLLSLPLSLRPRQARLPESAAAAQQAQPPRLRFDRPFLYFVRHNPTGLVLHMGRFNPRLIP